MNNPPIVYLCGPITGTKFDQATEWREYGISKFFPEIIAIDPTRDNPSTTRESEQPDNSERRLNRLYNGADVVARDRFDIMRSDIILVNFLGAEKVSIGSVGEIFWADAWRKPVVIVREKSGNIHDHDMLNAIAGWIFNDLDPAIEKIKQLIKPTRNK